MSALNLTVDTVFATYRGHGWALACGSEPSALLAELMGRSAGTNGGRGGSAYLSDPGHGFYGENSIVGASAPIATGAALTSRYDGSGPAGEVEAAKTREPIAVTTRRCRQLGATDKQVDAAERDARAEVAQAVAVASASPPADSASLTEHLYA